MSRIVRFIIVVGLFANQFLAPLQAARAAEMAVERLDVQPIVQIVNGLHSFASHLDSIGFYGALGQPVPLTQVSPSEPQLLALTTIFSDTLGQVSGSDMAELADAIGELGWAPDAADDQAYAGLYVNYDVVSADPLSFDVTLERQDTVLPIEHDLENAILQGGEVTATVRLDGHLIFIWNDDTSSLALDASSAMTVTAKSAANQVVRPFTSTYGFIEVNADGALSLDQQINIEWRDPNSSGRITESEWIDTALEDLVSAGYGDVDDQALAATFELNAADVDGTDLLPELEPDLTITVTATVSDSQQLHFEQQRSSEDADLDAFSRISADEMLTGFGQLAAALGGLQLAGDMKLPFMQEYMGDSFVFARPVIDFVTSQGDADIVCGSIPTVPPSGPITDLATGSKVYCQAFTLEPAQSVTWKTRIASGVTLTGTHDIDTVGPNPSRNMTFTLPAAGMPIVDILELTFSNSAGEVHHVTPRAATLQAFFRRLQDQAFFDGQAGISYDPITQSLLYTLTHASDPPPQNDAQLDFGDKLKEASGLFALSNTAAASASIDPQDATLDFTFGVLLADGFDKVKDRLFLESIGGQPIFQANAGVTATVDLQGRLGFLQVAVTGDQADHFQISRRSSDQDTPMLTVALTNAGAFNHGDISLTNVVTLTALFSDVARFVAPSCNMAMTSTLYATASGAVLDDTGTEAGGDLEVRWPDVYDAGCRPNYDALEVAGSTAFSRTLGSFDISPSLFGTHTAAVTSTTALTDTEQDFFELSVTQPVSGTLLVNLTDGSRCVVSDFGQHSLICEAGLESGRDSWWHQGDRYELLGDPQALLGPILDSLYQAADSLNGQAAPDIAAATSERLPLAPISPGDLMPQFTHFKRVVGDIRAGTTDAAILCGPLPSSVISGRLDLNSDGIAADSGLLVVGNQTITVTQGAITGPMPDSSEPTVSILAGLAIIWRYDSDDLIGEVDLNNDGSIDVNDSALAPAGNPFIVPEGGTLYCQGFTAGAVEDETINWSIEGVDAQVQPSVSVSDTVGVTPTQYATFIISGTQPTRSPRFTVSLRFEDGSGRTGKARLPGLPERPETLQELADALTYRLDLSPGAIKFSVADLPPPGAAGVEEDGISDLMLEIDYGICARNASDSIIDDCSAGDNVSHDPVLVPFNLGLEAEHRLDDVADLPGLVGLEPTLPVEFFSDVHLGVALSLEDEPAVGIMNTTAVSLEFGLATQAVDLQANIGAISVTVGAGAILTGGIVSGTNTVLTPTTDIDFTAMGVQPGDEVYPGDHDQNCPIKEVSADALAFQEDCAINWGAASNFQIGGRSELNAGAYFTMASAAITKTIPIADFAGTLVASLTDLSGDQATGLESAAVGNSECGDQAICARLSLMVVGDDKTYLGDLGVDGDIQSSLPTYQVTGTLRLANQANNMSLDLSLLSESAGQLVHHVEQELDGSSSALSIPLIGSALDGGAKVAESLAGWLEDNVPFDTFNDLAATTPISLEMAIEEVFEQIPNGTVEIGSVTVTTYCDDVDTECETTDSLLDVRDIRVSFPISQTVSYSLPLDIGIPGLPIGLYSTGMASAKWRLEVDFGLSRDYGPYIVTSDGGDLRPDQELTLGATVSLGQSSTEGQEVCNQNDPAGGLSGREWWVDHDSNRCITGLLGFLFVTMRDSLTNPTGVTITTTLDLAVPELPGREIHRLNYQALKSGAISLTLGFEADANVDLRFRTGLREVPGFPSVVGVLEVDWSMDVSSTNFSTPTVQLDSPTIAFRHLYLDAGEFLSQFVAPVAKEVKRITDPMMPVINTVRAPLPVLSDLSRMVGGSDISLFSLMQATSGSDLTLIRRVIGFVDFVNEVGSYPADSVFIPLGPSGGGEFEIDAGRASRGRASPGQEMDLIKSPRVKTAADLKSDLDASASVAFEDRGGLSFPFLQKPLSIFGLLMGKDVTLVHFDAGTMRATASVEYTYRFAVGPVPMSVTLAGSASLEGRFAMGYDTYGMRRLATGIVEPTASNIAMSLLDGIYIDDLDRHGNDVPEISLKGTISARAAIDLVIVSAGVGGGIRLTVDLNLDDRPDPDGKLRISEIAGKMANPWCLFEVSGRLEAFLEAWVKIDFFFFSRTWSFELARIVLLEFSAACDPPNPQLAHVSGNELILNIGTNANRRGILEDTKDEEIIVRQMNRDGTMVSVAGFGIFQEYHLASGATIVADAAGGNDEISLLPGVDASGDAISFTIASRIHGGSGADRITGGDGADTLYGDDDNDKISAGGGNDCVYGGSGDDALDGFLGKDALLGEAGSDRINGGPGEDFVNGGPDDDTIAGGPGNNSDDGGSSAAHDLGDWLFGGDGNDTIQGGWGVDNLYGDGSTVDSGELFDNGTCTQAMFVLANAPGNDLLRGDQGDDFLYGGGGNDEMYGGPGQDEMHGNPGHDILEGDDSDGDGTADQLWGDEGNDTLIGRAGQNVLDGGDDHDLLRGGPDVDTMFGGSGMDTLLGEAGNDTMYGDEDPAADPDPLGMDEPLELANGSITACSKRIMVFQGRIDLNSDGQADDADNGFFEGYQVLNGRLDFNRNGQISPADSGLLGDIALREGQIDLNGDGDAVDNGRLPGVGIVGDGGNADCLFGDDDHDTMFGGSGGDWMFGGPGIDEMQGDEHNDWMRGGHDGDQILGNSGDDHIFGDSGNDTMEGNQGNDTMRGGIGNDYMLGGSSQAGIDDGDDTMYGDVGQDIMLGDNGQRTTTLDDDEVSSIDPGLGGADHVYGNEDEDIIIGGPAGDYLYGNLANDILLGDHGAVRLKGAAPDIFTTFPSYGGIDEIEGNEGDDIILGGVDSAGDGQCGLITEDGDKIQGNSGQDILLGDSGRISRAPDFTVWRISTIPEDRGCGGADRIHGGDEDDIVLGGVAGDIINGDDGNDTILGDNGKVIRGPDPDRPDDDWSNDVFSTDPDQGGYDTINGNAGADLILGGSGSVPSPDLHEGDRLDGDTGEDILVGDNAYIGRDSSDVVLAINSTHPEHGDRDTIFGNDQADLILGGPNGDILNGDDEADIILGDSGQVMYVIEGEDGPPSLDTVQSTFYTLGGSDVISGNEGPDIVFGGAVSDTISGGDGNDILLGDHGEYDPSQPAEQRFLSIATSANHGGGSDAIHGDDGDDIILGQQAGDWLYGDAGQDDMTGGHNVAAGSDAGDTMYGASGPDPDETAADGADVMIGDNGVISRTLTASGWLSNTYNGAVSRSLLLFDVESLNESAPDGVSGPDEMWGNDGDDIMYGQGAMDRMFGGAGDDYMEGNTASDWMRGGEDDDDMIGGTGRINQDPLSGTAGRLDQSTKSRSAFVRDQLVTGLLGDTMYGDEGADFMLGDNGIIVRPLDDDGRWITLNYILQADTDGTGVERHRVADSASARIQRQAIMVESAANPLTAGSDLMSGGPGDDVIMGQFDNTAAVPPWIGDELYGDGGEDALIGDQGLIESRVNQSEEQIIAINSPFIEDQIYVSDTLFQQVQLTQDDQGGNDRLLGGANADWMHGGAGYDLMNGNDGNDRLFGGYGDDALWGGRHHDHLWGGSGNDHLDVRPRPAISMTVGKKDKPMSLPADWLEWSYYAEHDHYQDYDIIYGGWDQDAMQADVGSPGPREGDRLIDWVGAYNVYYVCPGQKGGPYGAGVIIRSPAPNIVDFLQILADSDGAFAAGEANTSGFRELAIVFNQDANDNSHPIHDDHPGHFTCDGLEADMLYSVPEPVNYVFRSVYLPATHSRR